MIFLIVDDIKDKVNRITDVIRVAHLPEEPEIAVVRNVADAVSYLIDGDPVDLMILDLNLPVRDGDDIKELSGLTIIRELKNRPQLKRPKHIIGLTAQNPIRPEAAKFFNDEGWALISYENNSVDWEEPIRNKIYYNDVPLLPAIIKQTIVAVMSTPKNLPAIAPGTELRIIETAIQTASKRDNFKVIIKTGGTFSVFTRTFMQYLPRILHLSGHGDESGIVMETDNGENEFIPMEALQAVLQTNGQPVRCLILNSCYSAEQALALSGPNLYVVGMKKSLVDHEAEHFVRGFYEAIGEGVEVPLAFTMGIARLQVAKPGKVNNPQLWLEGQLIG